MRRKYWIKNLLIPEFYLPAINIKPFTPEIVSANRCPALKIAKKEGFWVEKIPNYVVGQLKQKSTAMGAFSFRRVPGNPYDLNVLAFLDTGCEGELYIKNES